MSKSILVVLAVAGVGLFADDASAGWRRCCRYQSSCGCAAACAPASCCNATPACCNATPAAPQYDNSQPAGAPTQVTQAPANGYQSFSFEPGSNAAPAPVYVAPSVPVRRVNSMDQFRGDRKIMGAY